MSGEAKLFCPIDGRTIGMVPFKALWTGAVERMPLEPDTLHYHPCETCRKAGRPHWMRYEVEPPDPPVKVVVRATPEDKRRSA